MSLGNDDSVLVGVLLASALSDDDPDAEKLALALGELSNVENPDTRALVEAAGVGAPDTDADTDALTELLSD